MIKIFSIVALLFVFSGCGDTPQDTIQTSTNKDKKIPTNKNTDDYTPPVYHYNQSFDDIHTLLDLSKKGLVSHVTYICVGDSTRAKSRRQGQYLFYEVQEKLNQYNVTSHLQARAGHEAKQFNNASISPTWKETVDLIPNDGATTIVDYSLGINDYWEENPYSIQDDIVKAIAKIKVKRSKTHFVLTMPDRVYDDEQMTQFLKQLYIDLSQKLNVPLNNTVEALMSTQEETPFKWYMDDGFNVHLSREGQHLVAQFILDNMLP